ncbi:C2H2-type domain-containing protein [Plasmodiophora brassicae]
MLGVNNDGTREQQQIGPWHGVAGGEVPGRWQPFELPPEITAPEFARQYACRVCGVCCASAAELDVHRNARHVSQRRFPCEICGDSFVNAADLNDHSSSRCKIGGTSFTSSRRLGQHTQDSDVAATEFLCTICNRRFTKPAGLRRHLFYHQHSCTLAITVWQICSRIKPMVQPGVAVNVELGPTSAISLHRSDVNESADTRMQGCHRVLGPRSFAGNRFIAVGTSDHIDNSDNRMIQWIRLITNPLYCLADHDAVIVDK